MDKTDAGNVIMLDINEVNKTIQELEQDSTTFANCSKLADLYIVREFYNKANISTGAVEKEYGDILPSYYTYCSIKRKYQLNELSAQSVTIAMQNLYTEIEEFLHTLYSNSDMQTEREELIKMLTKFLNKVK